jgi:ribose transport system permease protein
MKREMVKPSHGLSFVTTIRTYSIFIIVIVVTAVLAIVNPKIVGTKNLYSLAVQVVPIGIMTMGAMFVLITGEIDLSAGYGVGLAAVIMGAVITRTNSVPLAVAVMVVGVISLGIVNGVLVSIVKLGSIISTLIMMTTLSGLIYLISSHAALNIYNYPLFSFVGRAKLLEVPAVFLIFVLLCALGFLLFNHTRIGFYSLAIGNNQEGARAAGINVAKWKIISFVISALCMGLSSIVVVTRSMRITPEAGGNSLLLNALAAAIIGGVSISGGKGSIAGVVIGSITIALLDNAVHMMPIHPAWNEAFKGIIIILVIVMNKGLESLKPKKAVS